MARTRVTGSGALVSAEPQMIAIAVDNDRRDAAFLGLRQSLVDFAIEAAALETPEAVLEHLDDVIHPALNLRVLCAARFPVKASDWSSLKLGRSVFLHSQAPKGWWEEWSTKAHSNLPIGYMLARSALAPHTSTEALQALQPIGADRWGFDLALKYGVRDWLLCPVGGRWLLAFWSTALLSKVITPGVNVMIYAAASFAAMRLEQLVGADPERSPPIAQLTPREIAVLRLISFGASLKDAARHLGLGEETVRTHVKKAQTKLGARNRVHAVAEAIRQHLLI